jgi:fluoroquinolone transport system permease protein
MITVKIEVIKIVGIILGSLFFSLLGMLAALYSKSLNMFVVIIIPIEVLFMLPAVFYLFGFAQNILILHPAVIILRFILGDTNNSALFLIELMVWIVIIYYITNNKLNKTLKELGGLIL